MSPDNVPRDTKTAGPSAFGERLRFVIWLSGLELGTLSNKEFAGHIGKLETQLSRWAREDPKPGWEIIKALALAVGINPAWLDDPHTPGAEQPELFQKWLAARRAWKKANPGEGRRGKSSKGSFKKLSSSNAAKRPKSA